MSASRVARLIRAAPYFPVQDVERSASHYERIFGFKRSYVGGTPPEFAIVERDGLPVMFRKVSNADLIRPNEAQGGTWDAFYWVDDLDALYLELQERGAEFSYHRTQQPQYHMTEFAVRDDSGYVLGFGETMRSE